MLFRCYRVGAEYIPCLVECDQLTEDFEVVEPAPVTVELFVVLQHSNHVQAFAEDVIDEGLICEPCIHQDIAGLYPGFQHVADHCHGGIRPMADRFLAALIAAFAPVDSRRGPHDMLPGIRGCHHVERNRNKAGAVRPPQGQHVESPDHLVGDMVVDLGKQFHLAAAVPFYYGIVKNEAFYPSPVCKR